LTTTLTAPWVISILRDYEATCAPDLRHLIVTLAPTVDLVLAIKIETATAIAVIGRQQSCLRKHSLFCRTGPVRNGGGARESQAFTRLSDTRLGPNAPEGAEDHAVPLEAPLHGTRIAMRLPAIASEITKPAQSYRAPGSTLPNAGKIDGLCHSSQTAQF